MSSVTVLEVAVLKSIAERFLGPDLTTVWSSRSHFSEVVCFRRRRQPDRYGLVVKRVMPWHWQTCANPEFQMSEFNNATTHFRRQLKAHGVPVASQYNCLIENGQMIHVSSEEGRSLHDHLLTTRPEQRQQILLKVVEVITGALYQSQPVIGLDPQLTNFGTLIDTAGRVFSTPYIDVVPPLCQFGQTMLVHYPNPTDPKIVAWEIERKFKPLGILRRLRFSILSIDLDLEDVFFGLLSGVVPDLYPAAQEFFDSLPDAAIKNGYSRSEVRRHIEGISLDGLDAIREVGVRLAPQQPTPRDQFLRRVFNLSRKDTSPGFEEPHAVRFERLKNELIQLVV